MTKKAVKGFAGAAGLIAILTVFSRLAGLARKLAQSWAMSDGTVASAYDTANTVPNVLFEVAAGGALAGAVIPLIAGYVSRQQHDRLSQTVSALISWILLVGIPVAVIVGLTAYPLVSVLFGPATDPAVISLSATLLQIFAIQIPLYGLSVVFTGVLQAHGKFGLPALAPLLSSIAVILSFSAYAYYFGADIAASEVDYIGVLILGLGTTFGVVIFRCHRFCPCGNYCIFGLH
ncbi:lipid II flippase MurJ [Arcanobacterium hippocoleae]|uniref:lipid II flippase MurJ n=1 Tax=Arcanobacterium hippocoleae TaxID=149017 RepID=UPI00334218BE